MRSYRTLFLDLDETLYPSSNGVWQAIAERIHNYLHQRLAIPADQVMELRMKYFRAYGTTLNGLMANHDIDPFDYLAFVHDVPLDALLKPDPALSTMLAGLRQKRVIFTNASRDYAHRVLRRLGIEHEIDLIVDIIALEFQNKPRPVAYQKALRLAGEDDPHACLLVDDRVANLLPAADMGMTTVLVGDKESDPQIDFHISQISQLAATVPGLIEEIAPGDPNEHR
jgi:putative hydrolase of the HAD superfamily